MLIKLCDNSDVFCKSAAMRKLNVYEHLEVWFRHWVTGAKHHKIDTWKINKHISLKIGLDVMKSHPLCRMHLVMHADCWLNHFNHLPAKAEVSLKNRSLSTLPVTWCTDTVLTLPTNSTGDRSAQLQTSSSSLLSGWTPNALATRLRGTGAWAQAARRANTYKGVHKTTNE